MELWQTLKRKTILDYSKFLRVEVHTVQLPDGQLIDDWPWLITPDYVNVVVETVDGRFLCFRQFKYGPQAISLAPVGGHIEPGEDPLLARAKREMLEETGYEAPDWIGLGHYTVDGNRGCATAHMFVARHARKITDPNADDLEEQELLLLSRKELELALQNGEFKVLGWTTAVALALLHLKD